VRLSSSCNTRVGAILYQALVQVMSEEEQVGLHEDAENAAHDAQQLFLLVKVPISTFKCLFSYGRIFAILNNLSLSLSRALSLRPLSLSSGSSESSVSS
jgi:hypothetical protein